MNWVGKGAAGGGKGGVELIYHDLVDLTQTRQFLPSFLPCEELPVSARCLVSVKCEGEGE